MQILLLAATAMEIAPFLQQRPAADFLISGVGCPSAVYHLTKRLHQIDYDLVIQAGIAGSFSEAFQPGDVVAIEQDTFADLGIYEKGEFHTLFENGLSDAGQPPFTNGWLVNTGRLLDQLQLPKVKAVTVNTVTDDQERISQLISKYDPQAESMEGAAMHYVCLQEGIPFIQLRSISNVVGERDKSAWKIKESVDNLNTELERIFKKLLINGQVAL